MLYQVLAEYWVRQHLEELEERARADRDRRDATRALRVQVERRIGRGERRAPTARIVIRRSRVDDGPELVRLARDPEWSPRADFVVAERSGSLLAAVAVAGGDELVDQGRTGADVVALVRLRAEQLRSSERPRAA